jgi:cellulose synthase/poly-beta-1,6-N-acetylglucosamine synthase-like glycosyltransferase
MYWYFYIALAAILSQLFFLVQMYRNYRYILIKYKKKRSTYQPKVVLIIPCRGLDQDFTENIASFFNQDYKNYLLWFVVADESDPAYAELRSLKNSLSRSCKAQDIQVHVAGGAQSCSQKNHNLLHCYHKIGDDVEVLVFADSDIRVNSDWLSYLVYPLRKPKNGVVSGYRWFVPRKNNLATLALSAVNAKIAQLFGNTPFNQAWGGSMAIRVNVFRRLGLDKIWSNSVSDDLSLGTAVKKAGLKVAFVPACLIASYEATTWRKLFEFGRRQFLITRVNAPKTWWFGLCSSLYSILGLWAGAALAVYAANISDKNLPLFAAVPILFFTSQLTRAILRQKMIVKLLKDDAAQMKVAAAADILFFWVWSLLLLFFIISSAFGRTIRWRGISYKLLGPTRTVVLNKDQ